MERALDVQSVIWGLTHRRAFSNGLLSGVSEDSELGSSLAKKKEEKKINLSGIFCPLYGRLLK
jgi:hypothetical protein